MLLCNTWGARARLRQWQASRRWSQAYIPNRQVAPLHDIERLAEGSDDGGRRLREAARETKNWPLLHCLEALATEAARIRKKA